MERQRIAYIAAILVGLVFIGAGFLLMQAPPIRNIGRIKSVGVGVYSDAAATTQLREIDWGMLEPGENRNFTAYVRNEGNVQGILNMSTDAWYPVNASSYIVLTWTLENQTLQSLEIRQATFTIAVAPSISGITQFQFDVIVKISG
jgi:hypothetical protein